MSWSLGGDILEMVSGPTGFPGPKLAGVGNRDSALSFSAQPLGWKQSPQGDCPCHLQVLLNHRWPCASLMSPLHSHRTLEKSYPFARGKAKQALGWNNNLRSHTFEY